MSGHFYFLVGFMFCAGYAGYLTSKQEYGYAVYFSLLAFYAGLMAAAITLSK